MIPLCVYHRYKNGFNMSLLDRLNKTSISSSIAGEIKKSLMQNIYISNAEIDGETLVLDGTEFLGRNTVYFNTRRDDVKVFNSKHIKQVKIDGSIVFYIDDNDFVFNPDVTFIADEIIFMSNDRCIRNVKNLHCKCRNFKVEKRNIRIADGYIECERTYICHLKNILPSTTKKYVKKS